jgi:diacylglycerol kinase (ATP)
MTIEKYIVFVNPISGNKSKDVALTLLTEQFNKRNLPFVVLPTNAEGNYSFLQQKIKEEGYTTIVICGGDGTVNQITKYVVGTYVNVAIIPLGSGNGLAFTAGISSKMPQAIATIFTGTASYIDAFTINHIYGCHNVGVGFDAAVAHQFALQKKRGPFRYVQLTASNFLRAKPFSFSVDINGETKNEKAFFIAVLNSNQFGNKITIAPKASLSDGLLDVVIVRSANKLLLLGKLVNHLKKGKPIQLNEQPDKSIAYIQAERIIIKNNDTALLHIDGEPVATHGEIEIKVIKQAFKLIQ